MARRIGVTRAALYNVLGQRSAVSCDLAVRFEAATGTSAGLLVRMQAGHDVWRARQAFRPAPEDLTHFWADLLSTGPPRRRAKVREIALTASLSRVTLRPFRAKCAAERAGDAPPRERG